MEIKWITLDNIDGTNTLRQHGFIANGETNISLCGKIIHYNEHMDIASFDEIADEGICENSCKLCKRKAIKE